jgi:two-component system LytT family sensor kinase
MQPLEKISGFLLRYKIFHYLFWAWSIFDLVHEREGFFGGPFISHLPDSIIVNLGYMIGTYAIIYYSIPNFLRKRKYALFIGISLLLIFLGSVAHIVLLELYQLLTEGTFFRNFKFLTISHFIDSATVAFVFIAVNTIGSQYTAEQKNRVLEKEKLQAELNFLQAQINPHFLFNALNSIYILIDINKGVAGETLLKFSNLLRYHLYDCKEQFVPIETEVNHLFDYVEIERVRTGDTVKVEFNRPAQLPFIRLAPFILMPFIENAFKHVSKNKGGDNYIRIDLNFGKDYFELEVLNSCDSAAVPNTGGIGLRNVIRRLNLLYPSNFILNTESQAGIYSAKLKIHGEQNQLHHSRR